jgi:8-oxo-dGTP diphosphatase
VTELNVSLNIPEFGLSPSEAEYVLRPGGYAVIFNDKGEIGVVLTPGGLALPGGGQEASESPEEAAVRETREECGLIISVGGFIGIADELVFAKNEGVYYRKRSTFFLAEVIESLGKGEPDHELLWLPVEKAAVELRHESQRWAVTKAIN